MDVSDGYGRTAMIVTMTIAMVGDDFGDGNDDVMTLMIAMMVAITLCLW